jgi:hypothetical protein
MLPMPYPLEISFRCLLIYDTPGRSHTEAVVMLNLIFNSREARHVQVLESSRFRRIKPWLEKIENLVFSGIRVNHGLLRYREAYIAAEKGIAVRGGEGDPSGFMGNWRTPSITIRYRAYITMREGLDLMEMDEPHICWAHPDAEFGDQVFLFQGCTMPVTLRPVAGQRNRFILVGRTYVANAMNNKYADKLANSARRIEVC